MMADRAGTALASRAGMMMKIALAMLLGALGGLLAAASTRLNPEQVTVGNDARAVVIVQAAWQDLRHHR
jgi:hypothetical protein